MMVTFDVPLLSPAHFIHSARLNIKWKGWSMKQQVEPAGLTPAAPNCNQSHNFTSTPTASASPVSGPRTHSSPSSSTSFNTATASTPTAIPRANNTMSTRRPAVALRPMLYGDLSVVRDPDFLIPPILHNVYLPDHERIPHELHELVVSMLTHNRGYQYWLWTNARIEEFLLRYFPQYYVKYVKLPGLLHKSDFIRYFLLYYIGGVYADMDMRAHRRMDPLLKRYIFFQ